ncbi:MAG: 6-phosphofructokinase, partial [Synergistaceae bacterium]|nr:6-phosphofructokinase [Synergistaceae bacterium]
RHAGFLALYVGIAVGATCVLIPEHEVDFEEDVVKKIQNARLSGSTHFTVVVAEGAGSAIDIGHKIHEALGLDPRVTVLGHIQRGGAPTGRDRETATRMGYWAVRAFAEGRSGSVICTQEGSIKEIPIEEALAMKKNLPMIRYEILEAISAPGVFK